MAWPCSIALERPAVAAALLVLLPLTLATTTGCVEPASPPEEDDSGSSGDEGAGTLSASGTTTGTGTGSTTTGAMTTAVDTTTFGPGCGPDPCGGTCDPECEPVATCLDSVWMCECDCPMTGTDAEGCPPLSDELDAWVDPSKTPAVDCGDVGPDDDAVAWQAMHDCVVSLAAGSSFRARWSVPAEDPFEYGAAGRVGAVYERGWFTVSGFFTVTAYACEAIGPAPDCTVDVGQACLTCEGQTEVGILCDLK
ncbi:MAG: hypothetical protein KDK70_11275 [Myxococcales bacterium]|nr:hypothetical protein [Myxococcales bacterium]